MTTLKKTISLNATPAQVWHVLTTDALIRQRCEPFSPGTHAVSDWKLGSDISWFAGEQMCVKANITTFVPNHKLVMTFYDNDPQGGFTNVLNDSGESYELTQDGDTVVLHVVSGPSSESERAEHGEMMNTMRDQALLIIKKLSER